jgi:hypothetical protein
MSCLSRMPTNVLARWIGIGMTALGALLAPVAYADDLSEEGNSTHADPSAFVLPPPPAEAAPRLAIEVHTGLSLPLRNEALCPKGDGCVLQAGGGVGFSLERRQPSGFGALVAYDAWFLDSDSVYELAVQQQLRVGVRYTEPTDFVFHPIFELSSGAMVFGDIFRAATVGVVFQGFSGVEAELTESFGIRLGLGMRGFSHTPFRTERDGVRRGAHERFSEAFFIEVGLTYM